MSLCRRRGQVGSQALPLGAQSAGRLTDSYSGNNRNKDEQVRTRWEEVTSWSHTVMSSRWGPPTPASARTQAVPQSCPVPERAAPKGQRSSHPGPGAVRRQRPVGESPNRRFISSLGHWHRRRVRVLRAAYPTCTVTAVPAPCASLFSPGTAVSEEVGTPAGR